MRWASLGRDPRTRDGGGAERFVVDILDGTTFQAPAAEDTSCARPRAELLTIIVLMLLAESRPEVGKKRDLRSLVAGAMGSVRQSMGQHFAGSAVAIEVMLFGSVLMRLADNSIEDVAEAVEKGPESKNLMLVGALVAQSTCGFVRPAEDAFADAAVPERLTERRKTGKYFLGAVIAVFGFVKIGLEVAFVVDEPEDGFEQMNVNAD